MRWYILSIGDGVLPTFIAAECVDEWWAKDELFLSNNSAVLSEDELRLDDELSPLLDAWNARNDEAWAAWEAGYAADSILDRATHPDSVGDDRPDQGTSILDAISTALEMLDEWETRAAVSVSGQEVVVGKRTTLRYYFASSDIWDRLAAVEERHGPEDAAQIARQIARDLASYSAERTKHPML